MLYLLTVRGKSILFSGNIHPQDYEKVEQVATSVFAKDNGSDLYAQFGELNEELLDARN